ncbi:MAG: hypothetical protein ACTSU7_00335 [Candidatus Heimdallarchaeaceae archaeon]
MFENINTSKPKKELLNLRAISQKTNFLNNESIKLQKEIDAKVDKLYETEKDLLTLENILTKAKKELEKIEPKLSTKLIKLNGAEKSVKLLDEKKIKILADTELSKKTNSYLTKVIEDSKTVVDKLDQELTQKKAGVNALILKESNLQKSCAGLAKDTDVKNDLQKAIEQLKVLREGLIMEDNSLDIVVKEKKEKAEKIIEDLEDKEKLLKTQESLVSQIEKLKVLKKSLSEAVTSKEQTSAKLTKENEGLEAKQKTIDEANKKLDNREKSLKAIQQEIYKQLATHKEKVMNDKIKRLIGEN